MDSRDQIVFGSLWDAIVKQLTPNIVALSFQGLVAAIDMLFISWLGTDALAAAALVFPCLALMLTIAASGLGAATSSLIATAIGQGQFRSAAKAHRYGAILAAIYGAVWTLSLLLFGRQLFSLLGAEGDHLELADQYSKVLFGGAILACEAQLLLGSLRGFGYSAVASIIATIGGIIQIIATPLLIFGGFNVPSFGIAGAGLGFIAGSLPIVILAPVIIRRNQYARDSSQDAVVTNNERILGRLLRIGGVTSLNGALNSLTLVVLAGIVSGLGPNALAALGIVGRIEYFGLLIVFGSGATTVIFVAMNYGAGRIDRARQAMWTIALAATALTGVACLLFAICPSLVTEIFRADNNAQDATHSYIRSGLWSFPLLACGLVIYYASIGLSRPNETLPINITRCFCLIATAWLAVHRFDLGVAGIGYSVALSSALYFLLMVRWSRKVSTWSDPSFLAST